MTRRMLVTGAGPLATELATGLRAGGHTVEHSPIIDVGKAAVSQVVADAAAALGAIDTIVHVHQSAQTRTTVVETTTEQWVATCEDSMTAAFHLTQAAHRVLRCSFCASSWELQSYACIYCTEGGEAFVTAAPDEERKNRRVEICGACGGYLKTVDVAALSPFPLVAIADLETTDLDVAAMERGYARPPLETFTTQIR